MQPRLRAKSLTLKADGSLLLSDAYVDLSLYGQAWSPLVAEAVVIPATLDGADAVLSIRPMH